MSPTKESPDYSPDDIQPTRVLLERALMDDTTLADVTISMHVAGGMPSQRYRFDIEVAGSGEAACELDCVLTKRKGAVRGKHVGQDDIRTLLKTVLATRILDGSPEEQRFLPDTVIGRLEIRAGKSSYQAYFAADSEQARGQGGGQNKPLLRAVDAIYAYGGKLIGKRSVKP